MQFSLTDEQQKFRVKVREFAEAEIRPRRKLWEEKGEFVWEDLRALERQGLLGLTIPAAYGGQGREPIYLVIALEEIARVSHPAAMILQVFLNGPAQVLNVLGSEELKRRFLPGVVTGDIRFCIGMTEFDAGSSLSDLSTTARPDGDAYVIDGRKCFTTWGHVANVCLVWARFGEAAGGRGIGGLLVERDRPGYQVEGIMPTMRGSNEAVLNFEGCRVPRVNVLVEGDPNSSAGLKRLIRGYNPQRLGNAAISVGLAQAAYEEAQSYSTTRRQYGRPICEFQGIQWMVVDMAMKIEAARMLTYRAGFTREEGFPETYATSMAKAYSNEVLAEVCLNAVQVFGGRGFLKDFPIESIFRAALGQLPGGGTIQIQKNTLAEIIYNRRFPQRLATPG